MHPFVYTAFATNALGIAFDLPYLRATRDLALLDRVLRELAHLVTLSAIAYAALELAEQRGRARALVYAIVLLLVAYSLPRLLLRRVVEWVCTSCAPAALLLLCGILVAVAVGIEQLVRALLL